MTLREPGGPDRLPRPAADWALRQTSVTPRVYLRGERVRRQISQPADAQMLSKWLRRWSNNGPGRRFLPVGCCRPGDRGRGCEGLACGRHVHE